MGGTSAEPSLGSAGPEVVADAIKKLREYQEVHGIDVEQAFRDAGGTRAGIIAKPKFTSQLSISFHKLNMSPGEMLALADHFGSGPPDTRNGGYLEVRWRDFATALLNES